MRAAAADPVVFLNDDYLPARLGQLHCSAFATGPGANYDDIRAMFRHSSRCSEFVPGLDCIRLRIVTRLTFFFNVGMVDLTFTATERMRSCLFRRRDFGPRVIPTRKTRPPAARGLTSQLIKQLTTSG